MVILWCLLALLALIIILLLLPIRVTLSYSDKLTVSLSYFLFRRRLYPTKKEIKLSDYTRRRVRKRRKEAILRQRIDAQKAALQKKKQEKKEPETILQKLRAVRLILRLLKNLYRPIISAVRIKVERLYISVATEDAAKTAILYGITAQSVAYILTFLEDTTKTTIKDGSVDVIADFSEQKPAFDVKIRFSSSPIRLLAFAAKAFFLLRSYTQQQDKK